MQEMIVNFLLRMCFVLGESKEKDLQVGLSCCSAMHGVVEQAGSLPGLFSLSNGTVAYVVSVARQTSDFRNDAARLYVLQPHQPLPRTLSHVCRGLPSRRPVCAIQCWICAVQALQKHAMFVLTDALQIWPGACIKMNYVPKLLQANTQMQLDPPPALVTGLDILQRVMEVQPQKAIQVRSHRTAARTSQNYALLWCSALLADCESCSGDGPLPGVAAIGKLDSDPGSLHVYPLQQQRNSPEYADNTCFAFHPECCAFVDHEYFDSHL